PDIISNSGKFLKTPDEETPVTLTGTFKNGNETRTKEINFKVSPGYGWNNVENVDFTIAPTSIDAKYKIGGVEGYNVTNDANGIKATRTGVDSKADSFSINVNFKVPLKEGIYYIEYEYNDSLSGTGASLWSSIDGDKGEGITFQQNKAAIQIPARTTPEQTTTGAWGPAISGHKTGVYEKIGFLYNSAEASFLPYLNANFDPNNLPNLNIPASYAKLYTRFAGTTQLKGIRSVVKTVGQNGWIGIKGLKVWKQEKVIPYKINSLDLVSSTVNITKSTDKNAFAVVCLYKNNTDGTLSLEKTTIKDITTLKTGQNQGQDIAFENAFVGEYDVIKVFLWNNMSDLKPLSSVYSQNK
ncbi:MAG: hypothetical protein RR957_02995, partial [Oscillospiraceae bacterium]